MRQNGNKKAEIKCQCCFNAPAHMLKMTKNGVLEIYLSYCYLYVCAYTLCGREDRLKVG